MLAIVITPIAYYIISAILSMLVLLGIYLMSNVKRSVIGNRISAIAMLLAIIVTLVYNQILPLFILFIIF